MKALAVLAFILGVMSMINFPHNETKTELNAQSVAQNFSIFRNEVHRYVFKGHKNMGLISQTDLDLPNGFVMLRAWQARIEAGVLYVWGEASAEEIAFVRNIFWGTHAIGRNANGKLEPSFGGHTLIPAFVENGNITSVVSIN